MLKHKRLYFNNHCPTNFPFNYNSGAQVLLVFVHERMYVNEYNSLKKLKETTLPGMSSSYCTCAIVEYAILRWYLNHFIGHE